MSSKNIKIPIIKNGFLVQTYSLFANRPKEIYPDNMLDYKGDNISYHHGAGGRPIVVHIKSERKQEGEPQYRTLPICHIQATHLGNGLSRNGLFFRLCKPNECAIARAFAYMKIIEEWGTGIPRIFRKCREYAIELGWTVDRVK